MLRDGVNGLLQVEELAHAGSTAAAAGDQRPQHAATARVERVLAVLQDHVVAGRAEPPGHERAAGWPARRAGSARTWACRWSGREEPVAQVAGTQPDRGPLRRRGRRPRRQPAGWPRNPAGTWPGSAHRISRGDRTPSVVSSRPAWPAGVHRDEHGPGLHHRQVSGPHLQAVAQQRGHPVTRAHPAPGGGHRDAVGQPLELPVGQGPPPAMYRGAFRVLGGRAFKQSGNRAELTVVGGRPAKLLDRDAPSPGNSRALSPPSAQAWLFATHAFSHADASAVRELFPESCPRRRNSFSRF